MSKVIAICNQKGGVGKTTTAADSVVIPVQSHYLPAEDVIISANRVTCVFNKGVTSPPEMKWAAGRVGVWTISWTV